MSSCHHPTQAHAILSPPNFMSSSAPLQGIKYLMNKSLLNDTPEDVALFLHREHLDERAVARYLGSRSELNTIPTPSSPQTLCTPYNDDDSIIIPSAQQDTSV